jgi:hypothetical protein
MEFALHKVIFFHFHSSSSYWLFLSFGISYVVANIEFNVESTLSIYYSCKSL